MVYNGQLTYSYGHTIVQADYQYEASMMDNLHSRPNHFDLANCFNCNWLAMFLEQKQMTFLYSELVYIY